jgi:hypothetical protein
MLLLATLGLAANIIVWRESKLTDARHAKIKADAEKWSRESDERMRKWRESKAAEEARDLSRRAFGPPLSSP